MDHVFTLASLHCCLRVWELSDSRILCDDTNSHLHNFITLPWSHCPHLLLMHALRSPGSPSFLVPGTGRVCASSCGPSGGCLALLHTLEVFSNSFPSKLERHFPVNRIKAWCSLAVSWAGDLSIVWATEVGRWVSRLPGPVPLLRLVVAFGRLVAPPPACVLPSNDDRFANTVYG